MPKPKVITNKLLILISLVGIIFVNLLQWILIFVRKLPLLFMYLYIAISVLSTFVFFYIIKKNIHLDRWKQIKQRKASAKDVKTSKNKGKAVLVHKKGKQS